MADDLDDANLTEEEREMLERGLPIFRQHSHPDNPNGILVKWRQRLPSMPSYDEWKELGRFRNG
jgi:hypothetical protein